MKFGAVARPPTKMCDVVTEIGDSSLPEILENSYFYRKNPSLF